MGNKYAGITQQGGSTREFVAAIIWDDKRKPVVIKGEDARSVAHALADFYPSNIGFDPWGSLELPTILEARCLKVEEIRTGYRSLSEACKILISQYNAKPELFVCDPHGNLKPDRGQAVLTALAIAVSAQLSFERHREHA